jgi:hypothetical protein
MQRSAVLEEAGQRPNAEAQAPPEIEHDLT